MAKQKPAADTSPEPESVDHDPQPATDSTATAETVTAAEPPAAAGADTSPEPEPADPDDGIARGPQPELHYLGDESGELHISGVPATDLTPEQIDHVVLQRTANRAPLVDEDGAPIPRTLHPGLTPGDELFDEARAAIVAELLASEIYEEAV